jgi:hypothetical protein
MDWFKGKFTGKPHILWEHLWFPVDFPLNQSIERSMSKRLETMMNLQATAFWDVITETTLCLNPATV